MTTHYILSTLALIFIVAAFWRVARDGFKQAPSSRTWLLVALIFATVSGWLWWTQAQR